MVSRPALHIRATVLIALTIGILAAMGWLWAGNQGVILALLLAVIQVIAVPIAGPQVVLRLMGGLPLARPLAPELHRTLDTLTARAGLDKPPELWVTPNARIEAISVSDSRRSAVAVSAGALRSLSPREIEGVLAHELSHLRAGDILLFRIIGAMGATIRALGVVGLVIAGALYLFPDSATLSGFSVLGFLTGPIIATLLEMALWRTRELAADDGAVSLTGDPRALATALALIERTHKNGWRRVVRGAKGVVPGFLSTHPPTMRRIQRLLDSE